MSTVSRAERAMIDLAVALVDGSDPRLHATRITAAGVATGLSPAAMAALERVLSRGVGAQIVRSADPASGAPVWRGAPMVFGSGTLDLLSWLHTAPALDRDRPALVLRAPLRGAEVLLAARAVELLDATTAAPPAALTRSAWVWLLAGEVLARYGAPPADLDMGEVLRDRELLAALGRRLSGVWTRWARRARAGDVDDTTAHGVAQEAVATGLLRACAAADVHELAGFLADLAPALAALPAGVWEIGRGDAAAGAWQRARRARVGLVRALHTELGGWERKLRAVSFVDDDHDKAQRRLRRFEAPFAAVRTLAPRVAAADVLPGEAVGAAQATQ